MPVVTLPRPHAGQYKVWSEAKRFNVLDCGRRFGKTEFGGILTAETCIKGGPVGWFAPGYKRMLEPWQKVRGYFAPITKRVSETEKRIELVTGGSVDFWSCEDSKDAGRSKAYKRIIVDESCLIRNLRELWQDSLRATLADYRGDAWFLSTPKGKDFFWELFQRGQDPDRKDWASWQMPTSTNPYILGSEIEDARGDMPPRSFAQEFLAQFLDAATGGLFDPEKWTYSDDTPKLGEWIRFWDLAVGIKGTNDYTVGALIGLGPDGTVWVRDVQRWRESWPISRERIKATTAEDRQYAESYGALYRPAVEKAGQMLGLIDDLNWGEKVYFYPESVKGDKRERASIWAPRQCAGKVCLMRAGWNSTFTDECHIFDGSGQDHDDQVDAVSGAFGLLYKSKGKVITNERTVAYGSEEWHIEQAKRNFSGRVRD
jgi:predicted phage terminase large subunit-like protein